MKSNERRPEPPPSRSRDEDGVIRVKELLQGFHCCKRLAGEAFTNGILISMVHQQASHMADPDETLADLPALAPGENK